MALVSYIGIGRNISQILIFVTVYIVKISTVLQRQEQSISFSQLKLIYWPYKSGGWYEILVCTIQHYSHTYIVSYHVGFYTYISSCQQKKNIERTIVVGRFGKTPSWGIVMKTTTVEFISTAHFSFGQKWMLHFFFQITMMHFDNISSGKLRKLGSLKSQLQTLWLGSVFLPVEK